MPPLILVTDGWLANAGDAAIYMAMTESLRRRLPGARVAIACHQREAVGDRYPELDLVPPLDSLAGVRWPWTTERDLAGRGEIEVLVRDADIVLAPGGGYLLERYRPEGRLRIYEELLSRGKRLMFYAQSIGRFRDPELRRRLASVLAAADLVLVRDEPSLEAVRELGTVGDTFLTADEALLLPRPSGGDPEPGSLLMTISTHPWEGGGLDELGGAHIEGLAESLTRMFAAGIVSHVTLASTVQGLGGERWQLEDDKIPAWAVEQAMPEPLRAHVVWREEYIPATEYRRLAADHAAVVSMRMHGAILGLVAGRPVLLANASEKARALMRRGRGSIRALRDATGLSRLDEHVAPLLAAGEEIVAGQDAALDELRDLARRNVELVAARI